MTTQVPFYVVDVFASQPLTGSPLPLLPDADGLDEAQLVAVAREFSQPETTFLLRPSRPGATVRLRSFTPAGAEVGGAGHNALGAWVWLEAACGIAAAGGLAQEMPGWTSPRRGSARPRRPGRARGRAGPGRAGPGRGRARAGRVHRGRPPDGRGARPGGGRPGRAGTRPGSGPCCTGRRRGLLPVQPRSRRRGRRQPTPGSSTPRWASPKTPPPGSAAGPLAARLAAAGQIPRQATVVIEQGHALGLRSRIQVEISGPRIRVGGSGLVVAEGTLTL